MKTQSWPKRFPNCINGHIRTAAILAGILLQMFTPVSACAERYLDVVALQDAKNDLTQSPRPGYALDANQVFRLPESGPPRTVILGDSILTGWSGYFAHVFPRALIDGKVGRQFSSAIPIWDGLRAEGLTQNARTVIVELGTNGEVSPQDLQAFLRLVGSRQVFLVMPAMPRSWAPEVQSLYLQTAEEHPNVHLVRWDLLSRNHPGYFWGDDVHPNWQGIQVMVHAIRHSVDL